MRISDWSSDVCSSDLAWGRTFKVSESLQRMRDVLRAHGSSDIQTVAMVPRAVAGNQRKNLKRVFETGCLRSEEHTSELQSLMRISYAVFCLKKKNNNRKERIEKKTRRTHTQDI